MFVLEKSFLDPHQKSAHKLLNNSLIYAHKINDLSYHLANAERLYVKSLRIFM